MRIAVFDPHPDLNTNPALFNLIISLRNEGADLDVFIPESEKFLPHGIDSVDTYPFPNTDTHCFLNEMLEYFLNLRLTKILKGVRQFWKDIHLSSFLKEQDYDLFLCVDSLGLVTAYPFTEKLNMPFIYLSFEIFFRDELKEKQDLKEKEREIIACRRANKIIIPDSVRAELLTDENGLVNKEYLYLPVAPNGEKVVYKTDYARKKFNIPSNKTIVLHSGSFAEFTYAEELIENLSSIPQDFVLIIHTRYKSYMVNRFIEKIRELGLPNVRVSTEPLSVSEYEKLLASVDIGLTLYKRNPSKHEQKNVLNIGLSSGKFAYYMKYGLPVITLVNQNTYKNLLKSYAFGIDIADIKDLPDALIKVRKNSEHHRSEAQKLFKEKLDFRLHWPKIRDYILSFDA